MRKNIFVFLIVLCGIAQAQFRTNTEKTWNREGMDEKKFSFGYYLGTNMLSFKVKPDSLGADKYGRVYLKQDKQIGFSVGLIGRMKINDHLDLKLEPGVHFAERKITFENIESINGNDSERTRSIKSTYIDIPILLNVHGNRWYNTRPYIQAGVGYAVNLQSNEKKDEDNADDVFRMTTHNFNWQAEMGVEIYFKRFKLTPSLKGIFFFNNELVQDNPTTDPQWAGSLKSLSTRAFVFSLKFE